MPAKPKRNAAAAKKPAQFSTIIDAPFPLFTRFPADEFIISLHDWRAGKWPAVNVLTALNGSADESTANAEIHGSLDVWNGSGSPLHLFNAFIAAVRVGVYPPVVVLQMIAKAFETYQQAKGQVSLEQAFLLKRGQGTWTPHLMESKRVMTQFVARLLYQSKLGHHLSTEQAAERVWFALEHHHRLGVSYTVDTLVKTYPAWKQRFHLDEADTATIYHPDNPLMPWDHEHRTQFLTPPDYALF